MRLEPGPNHWLQARPGFALLFVLAPRPGLPEPTLAPASAANTYDEQETKTP